jgi:hypothetical protein
LRTLDGLVEELVAGDEEVAAGPLGRRSRNGFLRTLDALGEELAAWDDGAATPDSGAATPDTGAATPDTGAATPDTGAATPDTGAASEALDRRSRKGLLRTLDAFGDEVSTGEAEAVGEVSAEVPDAFDGDRFSVIGCFKNSNMMDTRALRARGWTPTDLIDHSMSGH